MKTIIQYLYTNPVLNPDGRPAFQLNTINQGITQCRKLGWAPYAIILGKKEGEEIKHFSYPGLVNNPVTAPTEIFGLKVKHNHEESYLGFQCQEWAYKEKAELEKYYEKNS